MKAFAFALIAIGGFAFLSPTSASAGGVHIGIGNPYGGYHSQGWYNHGHKHHSRRGHYHYHDTSHYDYVPGRMVPHGNHYHYVPGGYYLHQSGHYDYHSGSHHHGH